MLLRNVSDFGRFIRGERERLGLTQASLAAQLGMARQTLIAIEAGGNSDIATLLKIASALHLEIDVAPANSPNKDLDPAFDYDLDEVVAGSMKP
jgi:transcriptional regulator with XRE-family HTH domain